MSYKCLSVLGIPDLIRNPCFLPGFPLAREWHEQSFVKIFTRPYTNTNKYRLLSQHLASDNRAVYFIDAHHYLHHFGIPVEPFNFECLSNTISAMNLNTHSHHINNSLR